jgi:signal transduction histidine kinase
MRSRFATILGENIRLELVLDEDLGEILADPMQIDDVIVSLVENARDAMPNGGLLKIETAAVEVGETAAHWLLPVSPGPYVMLSVIDTGLGMTPEVQAHIFEPFFTTKVAEQGAGLGLATVYSIVENCGGSIFVSSNLNHGTTFQMILPWIGKD